MVHVPRIEAIADRPVDISFQVTLLHLTLTFPVGGMITRPIDNPDFVGVLKPPICPNESQLQQLWDDLIHHDVDLDIAPFPWLTNPP